MDFLSTLGGSGLGIGGGTASARGFAEGSRVSPRVGAFNFNSGKSTQSLVVSFLAGAAVIWMMVKK